MLPSRNTILLITCDAFASPEVNMVLATSSAEILEHNLAGQRYFFVEIDGIALSLTLEVKSFSVTNYLLVGQQRSMPMLRGHIVCTVNKWLGVCRTIDTKDLSEAMTLNILQGEVLAMHMSETGTLMNKTPSTSHELCFSAGAISAR